MKKKSGFTKFLGEYSYIFVFIIIFIGYMIANNCPWVPCSPSFQDSLL